MTLKFVSKNLGDHVEGCLPGLTFYILEGDIDHWILSLIASVLLTAGPDFFITEIDGGVFVRFFEKGSDHVHVQGFAKPARPGKQGDLRPFIQKVPEQQRLIHVVIFGGCFPVIGDANWQRKPLLSLFCGFRLRMLHPFVHWLPGICRNNPLPTILICTGDPSRLAKCIYPAFCNPPDSGGFFDRHHGIPPFFVLLSPFGNIITAIPNKSNWIVPNDADIVRKHPFSCGPRKAL